MEEYAGKECEDCGSLDGEETTCPYAEEISGKEIDVVLCSSCYRGRCMDI